MNAQLWVDECKTHHRVFVSCIELMDKALKQDLCNLGHPEARAAEVDEKRMNEYLPRELRYACRYWWSIFDAAGWILLGTASCTRSFGSICCTGTVSELARI